MQKNYSWNPSICIFENGKYLKHIVDGSVIVCHEIMYVMDIVAANLSTNSDDQKLRYEMDCFVLHRFLLVMIFLFIINIFLLLLFKT